MKKMTAFQRATLPPESLNVAHWLKRGLNEHQAKQTVADIAGQTVWLNNVYQVNVSETTVGDGWPAMVHLSIKRRDRKAIRDWRHLQWIKDQLVGPENEGVELFPAHSRLVDSANQYHLWVLKEPGAIFPFGWTTQFIQAANEGPQVGHTQRDFQ